MPGGRVNLEASAAMDTAIGAANGDKASALKILHASLRYARARYESALKVHQPSLGGLDVPKQLRRAPSDKDVRVLEEAIARVERWVPPS